MWEQLSSIVPELFRFAFIGRLDKRRPRSDLGGKSAMWEQLSSMFRSFFDSRSSEDSTNDGHVVAKEENRLCGNNCPQLFRSLFRFAFIGRLDKRRPRSGLGESRLCGNNCPQLFRSFFDSRSSEDSTKRRHVVT